ncbi:MAG: hypothetical protein IT370_30125 [Deltaproteobacteria bacterium]|nr:hypothetical protein [Deltaproteobacteria bacterium]
MTTESPGRNLRLYLVAALALAYLVVWWSFGMQPKPAVAKAEVAPPQPVAREPVTRAPVARAPVTRAPVAAPVRRVQTVTTTTAARTIRPAPAPVRVQPRRVVRTRVRTRSS